MFRLVVPALPILIYHPLALRLPIVYVSHRWERPLARPNANSRHVCAVGTSRYRDAAHDNDNVDQSRSHWIIDNVLAPVKDFLVVCAAQNAFDEDEWPAEDHAVDF